MTHGARRYDRRAARLVLLATLALTCGAARPAGAVPAVFQGDPTDPATGVPYIVLPGVPLVLWGADAKWDTADDVLDPAIVGDVDIVLRTGGTYVPGSGVIPAPATGVAAAPEVIAGGQQFGAALGPGTEVAYQFVLSDGASSPAAGHPLGGNDLDGRGTLVVAYADLDGDGVVGPTGADGNADDAIEQQEALTLAGRRLALLQDGVSSGSLAVALGLPASAGGLGLVVGGGAITGTTPPLYKDGPWTGTLLPCMWPLDPDQIIGGENAGPPDAIGLVDLELDLEWLFCPAPGHPVLGTPYAIPLDGSSVTTDLLRAVSGPAEGATFAQLLDPATFIADLQNRVLPAIGPGGERRVVEPVASLALPDDGPGNTRTVLVFPADRLGNAADPPPGGLEVALEASPALRIVAPDLDGDPQRETLAFTTPSYVAVTIDDGGGAADGGGAGELLALIDGTPRAALRVNPGSGAGTPAPLATSTVSLRHPGLPGRDKLKLVANFDVDPAILRPANQVVTVSLADENGVFYTRTLSPGSLKSNRAGTAFRFKDPLAVTSGKIVSLVLRRTATVPLRHTLRLRVKNLDLSAVDRGVPSVVATIDVGGTAFEGTLACVEKAAGTITACAR